MSETPPCPKCGKTVESFEIEQRDHGWSITETMRVLEPAKMWVNPCRHPISGYVAREDGIVVEWKRT